MYGRYATLLELFFISNPINDTVDVENSKPFDILKLFYK
jgi:hypothetical protein